MDPSDLSARLQKLQLMLGKPVALSGEPKETKEEEDMPEMSGPSSADETDVSQHSRAPGQLLSTRIEIGNTSFGVGLSSGTEPHTNMLDVQSEQCEKKVGEASIEVSEREVGEHLPNDIWMCSWTRIRAYPHQFIGKTNKPLALAYFDCILEGNIWDFFYLYDPSKPNDKPALLVPTSQFERFLGRINRELGICLKIPGGIHESKFFEKFHAELSPRPRFLKRTWNQQSLAVEAWPRISAEDLAWYENASTAERNEFEARIKKMRSTSVGGKESTAEERAAKRRQNQKEMIKRAQQYFCLSEEESAAAEDVVFVCVDVEAIEVAPFSISEVGLAILDSKNIRHVQPGIGGTEWWPLIAAHHFRVAEHATYVNHKYVQGCPDRFEFGLSVFPTAENVAMAISITLGPVIREGRKLVFVGHDCKQDIEYLAQLGILIRRWSILVGCLDSQVMHQGWSSSSNGRSLGLVLLELGIAHRNLHNAGNDAVYTLRAVIGLALEAKRRDEANEKGEEYIPSLLTDVSGELGHTLLERDND